MATPSPTVFESTSCRRFFSLVSLKRRLPLPNTSGKTISRNSSTRSCSNSVCASRALPWTTMSPSCSCLSFDTSSTTSPLSTVELFHSGSPRRRPALGPPPPQKRPPRGHVFRLVSLLPPPPPDRPPPPRLVSHPP